jgi:hypothetical protein
MKTNMDASFPSAVSFDVSPIDTDSGIIYAAIVLLGLYVLIVLEVSGIAELTAVLPRDEHSVFL